MHELPDYEQCISPQMLGIEIVTTAMWLKEALYPVFL
jgi:hypothetical protein